MKIFSVLFPSQLDDRGSMSVAKIGTAKNACLMVIIVVFVLLR